jgi:magnesium transporter
MNTIFVHRDGRTEPVTSIDRSWLNPTSQAYVWVDLAAPSIPESLVLTDTFSFHPLAVKESRCTRHSPKIDNYPDYFFAAVTGADADCAFFVGWHFIVSVHWEESKAIATLTDSLRHRGKQFDEGPFALFHRLVDSMVDAFRPAVERLGIRAEAAEKRVLGKGTVDDVRELLATRQDAFVLSQRLARQSSAIKKLEHREVASYSEEMAFRFRDVRNQLERLSDDTVIVHQRLGDLLTTAASSLSVKKGWM